MRGLAKYLGLTGVLLWLVFPAQIGQAAPAEAYKQAIAFAAQGNDQAALASLSSLAVALPVQNEWQSRSFAAKALLGMRVNASTAFPDPLKTNPYLALASTYAVSHPLPDAAVSSWPVALLATVIPGAGHALQGRWGDAATAALMVWPMLILTFWAFRRRMGPVTLFFALITIWLWSGTVFSSISLAERGGAGDYLIWWQGVWQASGLPGRPM